MSSEPTRGWLEDLTRRDMLRQAIAGGATLGAGGLLAACGGSSGGSGTTTAGGGNTANAKLRAGGILRVGATGGGAKDTIDAHLPTVDTDIMRAWNLYESLAVRTPHFSELQMLLAESIEAEGGKPDRWVVKLKPDLTFHNGKPVTADDVIFSLRRITDPKNPKVGNASISYIDRKGLKKVDDLTVRIPLQFANANFPDDLGQYFNAIVPADYDPKTPVGTGPFKYQSFTPGQRSVFTKNENYWETGKPFVDQLVIIDFPDDTARTNALLGGQVDAIDNLPASQVAGVKGNPNLRVLISETGAWQPFTMRIDASPFDDNRVRQAMRLIVDRDQMVQQVLSGQGRVANDLYAPYDPAFAKDLPQRKQDLEQAKSLLKQAGRENLTVELVTAPVFQGIVEAAQVFAEQAKGAGVRVKVKKVDSGTFYGDNYLKWPFAQDFWATRTYLAQVAQGDLPNSPFNETHWGKGKFEGLVRQARAEIDDAKRAEILHDAQKMQYDEGGYIIPYFSNIIDAYSAKLGGFAEAKSGFPFGNYWFKNIGFVAGA
ncbi:MAG: peptide/nickel transport system substrate-binding protein [Solirubrobacteraceae bacterium]|jgi:peptide/nickel transport system substrate-binding protein|nr:peptide/nickel transport system substrate-binding protein [Solirubrobacteraceae bacterium]